MAVNWNSFFPNAQLNHSVDFFIEGPDYFKNIAKEIATLTSNDAIYIMGWVFDASLMPDQLTSSQTILDLLLDADQRGVEVRLLIWNNPLKIPLNATSISQLQKIMILDDSQFPLRGSKLTTFLQKSSTDIKNVITKLAPLRSHNKLIDTTLKDLDQKISHILSLKPLSICSNHDKVTIIIRNGEATAYCGGIDYNSNRLFNYHDIQCKVSGLAAEDIYTKFIDRWNEKPKKKLSITPTTLISSTVSSSTGIYAQAIGNENFVQTPSTSNFNRTLKSAYIKIIENAEKYIYLEDQYMIDIDIAKALNKRLRNSKCYVILLIQGDDLTVGELLMPGKKRGEFISELTKKLSSEPGNKLRLYTVNSGKAGQNYSSIVHSKLIIADDEIAIIGSGNVSRRSFTYDSETSLLFFDQNGTVNPIAKQLRLKLWTDYADGKIPLADIEDVSKFVKKITPAYNLPTSVSSTKLDNYYPFPGSDIDFLTNIVINSLLSPAISITAVTSSPLQSVYTKLAASLTSANTAFFEKVFDEIIDPKA